jgi:hypothetical protein
MALDSHVKKATANRRLAQWRGTWLIEHTTSHQLLWCIDSVVLRKPPLRQAPKRLGVCLKQENELLHRKYRLELV